MSVEFSWNQKLVLAFLRGGLRRALKQIVFAGVVATASIAVVYWGLRVYFVFSPTVSNQVFAFYRCVEDQHAGTGLDPESGAVPTILN